MSVDSRRFDQDAGMPAHTGWHLPGCDDLTAVTLTPSPARAIKCSARPDTHQLGRSGPFSTWYATVQVMLRHC
jgi:hypothetical protein